METTMKRLFKASLPTLFAGVLFFGSVTVGAGAQAQSRPAVRPSPAAPTTSEIYIGNSFFYYNNSLHGHVRNMLLEGDPALAKNQRSTSATISGSGLNWHDVESYFRPDAVGSYSFVANNEIRFNKPDKLFDAAIMMDCSQCPIHPQLKTLFTEFAKKDAGIVRKYGAKPIFFMSWAYADKPEMTAQLAEAYTKAGNDNDALVIPAGLAFARSVSKRPEVNLYAADKRHPSLAGTYLAASTVYASLYGKSPVGLKYNAGLDESTAAFLQNVAWETVQQYYQQP
jgi:hypothetical protein